MSMIASASQRSLQVLFQDEYKNALASFGADVGVQIGDLDANNVANHLVQKRSRSVDESRSHLFDELFSIDGSGQLLFGGRQDAVQPNNDHVVDHMSARLFRPAPHIVDFELNDGAADLRFDFTFGFHSKAAKETVGARPAAPGFIEAL